MKTRSEVAEFINNGGKSDAVEGYKVGDCWHYGKQDLRQLMDFIYDGEPEKEDELITDI